jgi:hypothetical protein
METKEIQTQTNDKARQLMYHLDDSKNSITAITPTIVE